MRTKSVYFGIINRLSLRTVIVIPVFLILLFGSTLTYLQIDNFISKYSENVVATNQIRIKNHIYDHLDNYFKTPEMMNKFNAILAKNKQLNLKNPQLLGKILLNEVNSNSSIDYAYFANNDGGIVSSGSFQGTNRISYTENLKSGDFKIYEADKDGNISNYIKSVGNFDFRDRDWYIKANKEGEAYWTKVYSGAQEDILGISTSYPLISDKGEKLGVFGTDILINKLSEFLRTIKITKNGIVCLVDNEGLIVASSTREKPFININESQVRLPTIESKNAVIREGYSRLNNQLSNKEIRENINVAGKSYHYSFTKYSHSDNINWNLMIAIPSEDLIGDIERLFFRFRIIFFTTALLILISYIFISRWILKPITSLNNKVNQMANNNWGVQISTERNDEIGQLTRSFNNMSGKLREYLRRLDNKQEELEKINNSLEDIVYERTKELELLSITDSLTNIYNKRYLMKNLQENIEISKRYNEIFSIVIFDIDHFKKVNDTYGHIQGDITLKEVSNFLSSKIRDVDVLGRYGGEEFMIIMTNTKLEDAYIAAQRYREELSKLVIGSKKIKITISGGVAEYVIGETLLEIVNKADENLYKAKEKGRNRIVK